MIIISARFKSNSLCENSIQCKMNIYVCMYIGAIVEHVIYTFYGILRSNRSVGDCPSAVHLLAKCWNKFGSAKTRVIKATPAQEKKCGNLSTRWVELLLVASYLVWVPMLGHMRNAATCKMENGSPSWNSMAAWLHGCMAALLAMISPLGLTEQLALHCTQ